MTTFTIAESKRFLFLNSEAGNYKARKVFNGKGADHKFELSTDSSSGYIEFTTEAATPAQALDNYFKFQFDNRVEGRKTREVAAEETKSKIAALLSMPVIPATLENIALLLQHLNNQNWGVWSLPQMSVGYKAHQYDCEGKSITTIVTDEPIEGISKFKSGSKRGHLEAYKAI